MVLCKKIIEIKIKAKPIMRFFLKKFFTVFICYLISATLFSVNFLSYFWITCHQHFIIY